MKIRPIIFSGKMVRQLTAGNKTETRRLATSPLRKCEAGDVLYVRETIHSYPSADGQSYAFAGYVADQKGLITPKKAPSIHMPRKYSRLALRVTRVHAHPLRGITEASCKAEGAPLKAPAGGIATYKQGFRELWNSLHEKECETWRANPQIVAITFEVLHGNVDGLK